MSMLRPDRGRFYRVKEGQTDEELERELNCPVCGAYAGQVIEIKDYFVHTVKPFESYDSVASRYGLGGDNLRKINCDRLVYPSQRLFIPRN